MHPTIGGKIADVSRFKGEVAIHRADANSMKPEDILSGIGFRPTVASGGTEMTACYRTLADSGALIIWGCLQGREFTTGCRPVSCPANSPASREQTVVFFCQRRIAPSRQESCRFKREVS
jgi:hypothetical protein